VTPVYKLSASSITGRTNYGSMLAGNPAYVVPTAFQSIATETVGGGGAATVEFTSIPATYSHLQVRFMARTTVSANTRASLAIGINSNTDANYVSHTLTADGSSASATRDTGRTNVNNYMGGISVLTTSTTGSNIFGVGIIDILDYANTSKLKTFRVLSGQDQNNSSGRLMFSSGFQTAITAAITSLQFNVNTDYAGNFAQYSHFALYGIKEA
jgi:hypothetical protein